MDVLSQLENSLEIFLVVGDDAEKLINTSVLNTLSRCSLRMYGAEQFNVLQVVLIMPSNEWNLNTFLGTKTKYSKAEPIQIQWGKNEH